MTGGGTKLNLNLGCDVDWIVASLRDELPSLRYYLTPHLPPYIRRSNLGNCGPKKLLRHAGSFDFVVLYDFLKEALQITTDPLSTPYFQAGRNYISITNDVCLNITGSSQSTFAVYDDQGIWNRIVC